MATPLAEKIKTYFPARVSTADGQALTAFIATAGLNTKKISDSVNSQADGYFDGAMGWFLETTTTAALRGQFFHVKTYLSNAFNLAKSLPATPVVGDTFRIIMGGKYRTTQELFGLLWAGKFPELVAPTTLTGITIKKVSPLLGVGTIYLKYTTGVKELSISMDAGVTYGVVEAFTVNRTDVALYLPNSDAHIIVDVVSASLPAGSTTPTYSITIPSNSLTPDYEGYESENDFKGKTRFRLHVTKNTSADTMTSAVAYLNNPTNTSTTKSSGTVTVADSTMVVGSATNLPSASFWIKNVTLNDIRYCDYRSGTSLHLPAVKWGTLTFSAGSVAILAGDTINDLTTGATAIVDQIEVVSGTFGAGTAAGTITFKEFTGSLFTAANTLRVGVTNCATIATSSVLGYRGKTAQTWANGNTLEIYPDIDIAYELPTGTLFSSPTDEKTIPAVGMAFSAPTTFATGLAIGDILTTGLFGIWHRETIVDKHKARANITGDDVILAWS